VGAAVRGRLRDADHKEQRMNGGKYKEGKFSRARGRVLWGNSSSRILQEPWN